MIALARQQVTAGNVTFVAADILTWAPPRRFNTVFLPAGSRACPHLAFGRFWSLLHAALTSSGRVLFVDDQPASAGLETYGAGSGEMVERCLRDGTRHQLIKVVRGPADITRQLTLWGSEIGFGGRDQWAVRQRRSTRG